MEVGLALGLEEAFPGDVGGGWAPVLSLPLLTTKKAQIQSDEPPQTVYRASCAIHFIGGPWGHWVHVLYRKLVAGPSMGQNDRTESGEQVRGDACVSRPPRRLRAVLTTGSGHPSLQTAPPTDRLLRGPQLPVCPFPQPIVSIPGLT